MSNQHGQAIAGTGNDRFDRESIRCILDRAAVEQHHLDRELLATYSLEELEEIAAEAGITRDALHAAIEKSRRRPASIRRRTRRSWFSGARGMIMLGAAGLVLLALLLAFPIIAQVLFWTAIAFLLIVLLVGSPA